MNKIILIFIHIILIGVFTFLVMYKPKPACPIGATETTEETAKVVEKGTATTRDGILQEQAIYFAENKAYKQILKTDVDAKYSYKVDEIQYADGMKGYKLTEFEKRADGDYMKEYQIKATNYETTWQKIQ
jgi:hypothetical protein